MNGVLVRWKDKNCRPWESYPGESSFVVFFRPILAELTSFTWYYDFNSYFPFPRGLADDEFGRFADEYIEEQGVIPPDTLLPRYAHYLIEDWTDLYGFRDPTLRHDDFFEGLEETKRLDGEVAKQFLRYAANDSAASQAACGRYVAFVRKQGGKDENQYLADFVDLSFFNVQGHFWEMYCKDEDLLSKVRQHVAGDPNLLWEDRLLLERVM